MRKENIKTKTYKACRLLILQKNNKGKYMGTKRRKKGI